MTTKQHLADKARAEMRARIFTCEPFKTADLTEIGVLAGQSRGSAGNTAANLIQVLKGSGLQAISRTGPHGPITWQMNGTPAPESVPVPVPVAPLVLGPYDPDPKIEGRNSGLTEALAEKLWRLIGGGEEVMDEMRNAMKPMEAHGWRKLAHEVQLWMFDRGFVGPGGPRRKGSGLDYAWVYQCSDWAIQDADGGHVALVSDDQDVPLFLAAPRMRTAIEGALARFEEQGGLKRSDLEALRQSLPAKREAGQ